MTDSRSIPHQAPGGAPVEGLRDSLRYWERGRIAYNLILSGVVAAWLVLTWPHFRPALTPGSALRLLGLAAMANVCYCTAYPVDLALQCTSLRQGWRKGRWALWWAGAFLAALLACYWIADEIYPCFP